MIPPNTNELKLHTVELAEFAQKIPRSIGNINTARTGAAIFVAVVLVAVFIVLPMIPFSFSS